MNRVDIVMKALNVGREDGLKIVEHLIKQGCEDWIDDFVEDNTEEPLTDVHYESNFEDMIDWQYEDCKPSEMLEVSSNISDHVEMLKLSNEVIFWYGLV